MDFKRYVVVISRNEKELVDNKSARVLPTLQLVRAPTPANMAELLWRIAVPLMCLMQMLLAIPLGFVNPRRGRTLNLMIALVLSVSYSNAVGIMQAVVGQGKLSFTVGWWPLHATALAAIMLLFVWRNNTNSAWHPARLLAILRRTLLPRKKEAA